MISFFSCVRDVLFYNYYVKFMYWSKYFLPTNKNVSQEAQIVSHRLMLRANMVHQASAGIYNWLPFGLKVLRNIEQVIRQAHDEVGYHEVLMPTIQSAELWHESGRYNDYGEEMLRFRDRHNREMLYGPTHEEQITDIARRFLKSYRDLPLVLYQIQWKFRDEIRPRFGVMRGREFLMKDAYSFALTEEGAQEIYYQFYSLYLRIFNRLGLRAIPVKADTGAIGGNLSHEFNIVAETGENIIFYDKRILSKLDDFAVKSIGSIDEIEEFYAVTSDKHTASSNLPEGLLGEARGIEVGHIFSFGTKYSTAMGASVQTSQGDLVPMEMGSYGIGVSRLVGAIIEAFHDEAGIIWPKAVTPFHVGMLSLQDASGKSYDFAENAYQRFQQHGLSILWDDRDISNGSKFADMDLIGLPLQIIIGPKGVTRGVDRGIGNNRVEIKERASGQRHEFTLDEALNFCQQFYK